MKRAVPASLTAQCAAEFRKNLGITASNDAVALSSRSIEYEDDYLAVGTHGGVPDTKHLLLTIYQSRRLNIPEDPNLQRSSLQAGRLYMLQVWYILTT